MRLVLELDAVLNTKGRQNVDKLQACQNTWTSGKLIQIKPGRSNSWMTKAIFWQCHFAMHDVTPTSNQQKAYFVPFH